LDQGHRQVLRDAILDEEHFVRAAFSGHQRNQIVPWKRVALRPVQLRGGPHVQLTFSDGEREEAENLRGQELAARVDELLDLPFRSLYAETTHRRIQFQVTRRGKTIVHEHEPDGGPVDRILDHDRRKDLPLPVGRPDPFLERAGIATSAGKVRPGMRRKFRQVNEFLKLALETEAMVSEKGRPLRVVDCGCGSAHLTFAMYHYLNHKLSRPAHVTGIDLKEDLLNRLSAQVAEWGWEDIDFVASRILDYEPPASPTIVLALHACDTATDEALAQAVRWGSEVVLAVPCCQHHLQRQLTPATVPPDLRVVARNGILRQRLGDLLTDGLRAQILRIMGYRTDVVEFISTEHTAKNLMIRAVRTGAAGRGPAIREYQALVGRWPVTPHLAKLLAEELDEVGVPGELA
jgi:SAM-dependent methyltransferase